MTWYIRLVLFTSKFSSGSLCSLLGETDLYWIRDPGDSGCNVVLFLSIWKEKLLNFFGIHLSGQFYLQIIP